MSLISKLPIELLLLVFSFLSSDSTRRSFRSTCKEVRDKTRLDFYKRSYVNLSHRDKFGVKRLEGHGCPAIFGQTGVLILEAQYKEKKEESSPVLSNIIELFRHIDPARLKTLAFTQTARLDEKSLQAISTRIQNFPNLMTLINPQKLQSKLKEGKKMSSIGFYAKTLIDNGTKHLFARPFSDMPLSTRFLKIGASSTINIEAVTLFCLWANYKAYTNLFANLSAAKMQSCKNVSLVSADVDCVFDKNGFQLSRLHTLELVGCTRLPSWLTSETILDDDIPLKRFSILGLQQKRSYRIEDQELELISKLRKLAANLEELYLELPYAILETPPSQLIGKGKLPATVQKVFIWSDNHELSISQLRIIVDSCPTLKCINVEVQNGGRFWEKAYIHDGLRSEFDKIANSIEGTQITEICLCIRQPDKRHIQVDPEGPLPFLKAFNQALQKLSNKIETITIRLGDPGFDAKENFKGRLWCFGVSPAGDLMEICINNSNWLPFSIGPLKDLPVMEYCHLAPK